MSNDDPSNDDPTLSALTERLERLERAYFGDYDSTSEFDDLKERIDALEGRLSALESRNVP